jgi:predicted DCC family thiol-disulfide oxidoreductase YuxK
MSTPSGWILYDDSCGFCRRWVPFWEATLLRSGFEVAPLQSAWVREKVQLGDEELVQEIRLLLPNGELVSGADVYRYAFRRIWWAYPAWILSSVPLLRQGFDRAYRLFARHRHRVSDVCGLPGGE